MQTTIEERKAIAACIHCTYYDPAEEQKLCLKQDPKSGLKCTKQVNHKYDEAHAACGVFSHPIYVWFDS